MWPVWPINYPAHGGVFLYMALALEQKNDLLDLGRIKTNLEWQWLKFRAEDSILNRAWGNMKSAGQFYGALARIQDYDWEAPNAKASATLAAVVAVGGSGLAQVLSEGGNMGNHLGQSGLRAYDNWMNELPPRGSLGVLHPDVVAQRAVKIGGTDITQGAVEDALRGITQWTAQGAYFDYAERGNLLGAAVANTADGGEQLFLKGELKDGRTLDLAAPARIAVQSDGTLGKAEVLAVADMNPAQTVFGGIVDHNGTLEVVPDRIDHSKAAAEVVVFSSAATGGSEVVLVNDGKNLSPLVELAPAGLARVTATPETPKSALDAIKGWLKDATSGARTIWGNLTGGVQVAEAASEATSTATETASVVPTSTAVPASETSTTIPIPTDSATPENTNTPVPSSTPRPPTFTPVPVIEATASPVVINTPVSPSPEANVPVDPENTPAPATRYFRGSNIGKTWVNNEWVDHAVGPDVGQANTTNSASTWEAGGRIVAKNGSVVTISFGEGPEDVTRLKDPRSLGTVRGELTFDLAGKRIVYFPAYYKEDDKLAGFMSSADSSSVEVGDWMAIDAPEASFAQRSTNGTVGINFAEILQ